jgi:type IV secretory pathway TraG/TraD family ATPase VirD4
LGFQQTRTWGRTSRLRIPRAIESSHVLIMGDSGTGKSVLIRQLLEQIEARGESAIVYDPALEYTGQFYVPDRGDVILNPLDARSPFWSPGDEWRHEAETLTLATSLFPDRHHDNAFFTEGPRRIFAYLLTLRPTPEELAFWLCHDEELDRRVRGTAYAAMIDRQAPAQRSGVLASLNMVADTLQLLPSERDTTRRWSAAAWATSRTGWLFLTSTPETRPRLVPLTSLWSDTLVLRLMHQGQPHPRRTWFILDELASLQRLPQLHTAITENRKSNNPVVLGFQGRSQLETRYGHDAEAMLSQPATKIFLRTSEPRAAKWIAEAIGDVEIERLRESRSHGRGGQQTYGLERQVEPLVMASEISGLPVLRGFLKVGNLVVRLSVPFVRRPEIQPPFIERTHTRGSRTPAPVKPEAGLSPLSGSGTHTQDVHRFLTRGRDLELE